MHGKNVEIVRNVARIGETRASLIFRASKKKAWRGFKSHAAFHGWKNARLLFFLKQTQRRKYWPRVSIFSWRYQPIDENFMSRDSVNTNKPPFFPWKCWIWLKNGFYGTCKIEDQREVHFSWFYDLFRFSFGALFVQFMIGKWCKVKAKMQ